MIEYGPSMSLLIAFSKGRDGSWRERRGTRNRKRSVELCSLVRRLCLFTCWRHIVLREPESISLLENLPGRGQQETSSSQRPLLRGRTTGTREVVSGRDVDDQIGKKGSKWRKHDNPI